MKKLHQGPSASYTPIRQTARLEENRQWFSLGYRSRKTGGTPLIQ